MNVPETVFSHEWLLFLSVCESKSLKETAERFNISTSSASRSLKRLEDSVGVTLFDRCSKPMVLTESGKRLYRQVLPAMKITQEAMEQVREENYLFCDLRIGFLESMSLHLAPQFLSTFKKKVGRITCLTGSSDRLLECLRTHDLDIIISSDPALRYTDWRRLMIIREPSVAVFPKAFKFEDTHAKNWQSLALCNLPFINSYEKSGRGKLVNNFLLTYGIQLNGKINVDNLAIKLAMVIDNNGWTITSPLSLMTHSTFLDKVTLSALPGLGMERKIYLLSRSDFSQELFESIAREICRIYKESVMPTLKKMTPELKDSYFVPDFDEEIN